jgi:DNA-binding IclR family transcriptional regulator
MALSEEHRAEILRLVKGSPQPEVNVGSLAERTGLGLTETRAAIETMVEDGQLRWEGERLLAVEPAASEADRPIP